MRYYLAANYAYRQRRERPPDQWNDPIMVGDLPLKRQEHLVGVLNAENPPTERWNPNYTKGKESGKPPSSFTS